MRPLLVKDCSSINDLNQDILSIAQNLQSSANTHIPAKRKKPQHTQKVHDRTLSHLCWKSRCALEDGKKLADLEVVSSMMIGGSVRDVQQFLNKKRGIMERKRFRSEICSAKSTHVDSDPLLSASIPLTNYLSIIILSLIQAVFCLPGLSTLNH